jgi:hypothetical protein
VERENKKKNRIFVKSLTTDIEVDFLKQGVVVRVQTKDGVWHEGVLHTASTLRGRIRRGVEVSSRIVVAKCAIQRPAHGANNAYALHCFARIIMFVFFFFFFFFFFFSLTSTQLSHVGDSAEMSLLNCSRRIVDVNACAVGTTASSTSSCVSQCAQRRLCHRHRHLWRRA